MGVGTVTAAMVPIEDFNVHEPEGNTVSITSLPLDIAQSMRSTEDPEKAEYMVGVNWIKTVQTSDAVREKGFFGNQNSVARPRTSKWNYTVERLKKRFGL